MNSLGTRFKKMRMKKGCEIDKLSYLTKIDAGILERVEAGDLTSLSLNDIMILADTLNTSLDYLLNGIESDSADDQDDFELNDFSFLLQVFNEDILAYMSKYPVTHWANLFRTMCKNDIGPDGMCKLIDAVDSVKAIPEGKKNGNDR